MDENEENSVSPDSSGKTRKGFLKPVLVALFLALFVAQFFQPEKNNNDFLIENDVTNLVSVPDSVEQVLKDACYDCHSNNTQYPWYTNIQPIGWWLEDHIKDGKRHLNFNELAALPERNGRTPKQRQLKAMDEIKEQVEEGEMPLWSYTLMHNEADLSDAQKKMIINWADSAAKELSSKP